MSGMTIKPGMYVTVPGCSRSLNFFQVGQIVGDEVYLRGCMGSAGMVTNVASVEILDIPAPLPEMSVSHEKVNMVAFPINVGEKVHVTGVSGYDRKIADGFFQAISGQITHKTTDERIHELMSDLWGSGLTLGIVGVVMERAHMVRDAKRAVLCDECGFRVGSPRHSRLCG